MSQLFQVKEGVNQWWDHTGKDHQIGLEASEADLARIDQKIEGINESESGGSPVRFLLNSWRRARDLPQLEQSREAAVFQQQSIQEILSDRAEKDADELLQAAAENDPELFERLDGIKHSQSLLGQKIGSLQSVETKTRELSELIENAIDVVVEARELEQIDVVPNPLTSILSHSKTSSANEAIEEVAHALEEYKEFMEKKVWKFPVCSLTVRGLNK